MTEYRDADHHWWDPYEKTQWSISTTPPSDAQAKAKLEDQSEWLTSVVTRSLNVVIDAGAYEISAGFAGDYRVDLPFDVVGWALLADRSGDVVIDVWKSAYASFPPSAADSICGSSKPTISGADKAKDEVLSGWLVSLDAGDTLRFNVDSASTIRQVTLILTLQPRS